MTLTSPCKIVYRVDVKVQPGISAKYKAWISEHIREVIANPGFTGANLMVDASETRFTVDYFCENEDFLNAYLENRAPALRQKAIDVFGDQFTATREIYPLVKSFQT